VNGLFVGGGDEDAAPPDTLRVLTLLARGEQEAGALDADPALQAELYTTLGGIYQALGQLGRADTLLQRALAERRAELGADHPDVAQGLVALGMLRMDQSRLEEADSLVRRGLSLHERQRERDPAATARFTRALGRVLVTRGDYDGAVEVLTRATVLDSIAHVPAADVSSTLTELANSHFYAGHYAVADSLNRRVLELDRSLFGARHPRVAGDLFNLGAVRQEMGEWEAAERYYRQSLEIYRGWYGENHFETAACLNAVGRVLVQQNRQPEAAELLAQALAARERIYGAVHPTVASTLNEMGLLAQSEGRFDDAIRHLSRMHAIYDQVYGGRHYLVGLALANLGSVYTARGDNRSAEGYFRRALERYREVLPDDHLYVGVTRLKLGRALMRQSRWADGERETRAGYEVLAKQPEPPFAFLQNGRRDLMRAYAALGRAAESERFRKESEAAAVDSARDAAGE
jgi:serine/threonine-protein kinase